MRKINYVDPANWHIWRQKGIGSSDAPAVMGKSPWCTPYKLWEIKTGRREPDPQTYPMKRGIEMEPVARREYTNETGILMNKCLVQHPTIGIVRASLDGINETAGVVLEIKCPGKEDHATAVAGKIPEKYLYQCVHLLLASGLTSLDYYSFDGERGVVVEFERDNLLEQELLYRETIFWNYVTSDIAPPQTMATKSGPFSIRTKRAIDENPSREMVLVPPVETEVCAKCGETKSAGLYGFYCKPCWQEKKDRKKSGK
jgi:putative phage-type endonuclease